MKSFKNTMTFTNTILIILNVLDSCSKPFKYLFNLHMNSTESKHRQIFDVLKIILVKMYDLRFVRG